MEILVADRALLAVQLVPGRDSLVPNDPFAHHDAWRQVSHASRMVLVVLASVRGDAWVCAGGSLRLNAARKIPPPLRSRKLSRLNSAQTVHVSLVKFMYFSLGQRFCVLIARAA